MGDVAEASGTKKEGIKEHDLDVETNDGAMITKDLVGDEKL